MGYWEEILLFEGGEALAQVPRKAVAAPRSLEVAKVSLDRAWSNLGATR